MRFTFGIAQPDRARGFLALLGNSAIRSWGSWHWGSSKALPDLGVEQDVWAFSHGVAEGARLLLNSGGALWWDKRLKKRQVVEQGQLPRVLQWQVAGAGICSAFDESAHLPQPPVRSGAFIGCCSKTPTLDAPHSGRYVPMLKCPSRVVPPPFPSLAAFPHPPLVLFSVS